MGLENITGLEDSSLSIAPVGPEGNTQPAQPADTPILPGNFLINTRKRAIANGSALIAADSAVILPNLPAEAMSAILVCEAFTGSAAGNKPLARFWMDGTWPTNISGLPLYDGAVVEIIGQDDLKNTRLVSADGITHKINVQYFNYL